MRRRRCMMKLLELLLLFPLLLPKLLPPLVIIVRRRPDAAQALFQALMFTASACLWTTGPSSWRLMRTVCSTTSHGAPI